MAISLHTLLSQSSPTEFRSIERALVTFESRGDIVEVCLSGLKWVRVTDGGMSILGAVTWVESASRVSRMADDLDAIGATDAAAAFRKLRSHISLSDDMISRGLVDWVDTEPVLRSQARQLNEQVSDISDDLWAYMQKNRERLPDIPVATSSLGGWSRSLWSKNRNDVAETS